MYALPALQTGTAVSTGVQLGGVGTCSASCPAFPRSQMLRMGLQKIFLPSVWQQAGIKHSLSARHCSHDGSCVHKSIPILPGLIQVLSLAYAFSFLHLLRL